MVLLDLGLLGSQRTQELVFFLLRLETTVSVLGSRVDELKFHLLRGVTKLGAKHGILLGIPKYTWFRG